MNRDATGERGVYDHRTNPLNKAIDITALGNPGPGGAHTRYRVTLSPPGLATRTIGEFSFQSTPAVDPLDYNGLTNEVLLAIVLDRLTGFQSGPYPCLENGIVITKLEKALFWLQKRSIDRERREVEGKHAP